MSTPSSIRMVLNRTRILQNRRKPHRIQFIQNSFGEPLRYRKSIAFVCGCGHIVLTIGQVSIDTKPICGLCSSAPHKNRTMNYYIIKITIFFRMNASRMPHSVFDGTHQRITIFTYYAYIYTFDEPYRRWCASKYAASGERNKKIRRFVWKSYWITFVQCVEN